MNLPSNDTVILYSCTNVIFNYTKAMHFHFICCLPGLTDPLIHRFPFKNEGSKVQRFSKQMERLTSVQDDIDECMAQCFCDKKGTSLVCRKIVKCEWTSSLAEE